MPPNFRKPPVRNPPAFLPRQIVSPCRVRISSFNHLGFAQKMFEHQSKNTAKIENRNQKPKYGRREAPTIFRL
ncbi:hypothetical protein COY12_00300 [Candidatus Roizmanbacteria bacterium CG_4_10_14_0_2_um_filter_33_96]|uniref:Uncharacterized protein n=1 Tax=Candidatus Roizmanbacteria bacterium CG_4_10_14_0_2_um_filter_33_96 TaxID=1974821 RepID=A0A2M7UB15_9BACT|nr:MAG: hypothetical protein COY12_00300 [Candidatus Roizmanbacteria bacterium CG_4_10_14_0_2_um_filter_33_96]